MNLFIFQQINPVKDLFFYLDSLDIMIFNGVNNLALKNLYLDEVAIFCAEYLGYLLLGVLFVFLIKDFKKYQKIAGEALVSVILARLVIVEIIRWLWPQTRPFVINQVNPVRGLFSLYFHQAPLTSNGVNLLLYHTPSASFPSGHTAFFFALSTLIYFYNKKAGFLFLSASFLIGISRIFCGLHWPADILAGALVGIFSALLVKKIFSK
ncbi:hypothetical protein COS44_01285 [bacterium (Candidatus Gribaldobacteria) CG03_land_8_20_14_0_80_36_40]|uniref:Phosphatidic acid phosphatase type 2/haloperoxidase domain-containing protein n=4 Tax=Candidatus Gribaldobacteria TaxID=2798536 RepID=A0A2M7BZ61_9BACT|nr:MAG: hypothetical protein COS44_01285 [bacterium (Candidatus Gribaldobacteria) CG03_land_8_20_14_0_80_36_40]